MSLVNSNIANCTLRIVFTCQFAVCSLQFAIVASANAQNGDSLANREEAALRAAAESVAKSVVQIRTIGGLDTAGTELRADGPTTGLVISPDGYIITSTFNFAVQPASILVTFASGKQASAELIATDDSRMLVLLKVHEAVDLPVPELVPADEIRVGQWAVAVGRTFRADRINVSVGIVSATGRMFGKVLQTDADVSTANYGGLLVDIRGRVLGVIVPMAPQGAGEVAGAEWYDSGIGFAVPLVSITDALERMKRGEDQYTGILGIGMTAKSPHSDPAELATVRPDSPAGVAGLKKGDRIIEIDGRPIKTQTDLRFALGSRYGGESVSVVAMRGKERVARTITLAGELKAFRHAFLGLLPLRATSLAPAAADGDAITESNAKVEEADDEGESENKENKEKKIVASGDQEPQGVVIRMVYPGSPAAEAGIQAGDRIVKINRADIDNIDDAIAEVNNVAPGGDVSVRMRRGVESKDYKLAAARLPTGVPEQLPSAFKVEAEPPATAKGKTRKLKLAEFKESCQVYVPPNAAGRPLGLLLWLHAPGEADAKAIITAWQPICDRDGLLLVVPTAADAGKWERTELEYLRRLTERVVRQYKPDPRRVVVYGQGGGGAMAWLLALSSRDIFRGVATTAAPLPRQIRVPENEPAQRLAVFAGLSGDEGAATQIAQGLTKLADAGYPVTTITNLDRAGRLSDEEHEQLARWIDTLDRF